MTTALKSIDTVVIIATTTSSITLSLKRIGLIVTPISTASACALSIGSKVVYEIALKNIINTENNTSQSKKLLNRSIICTKKLQDSLIDRNEYDSQCNVFTRHVDETNNDFFIYKDVKKIYIFLKTIIQKSS